MFFDELIECTIYSTGPAGILAESTDGHKLDLELPPVKFSHVIPEDSMNGEWKRTGLPPIERGQIVLVDYEMDYDENGAFKVILGWTTKDHFFEATRQVFSDSFRIVRDDDDMVLWTGMIDRRTNELHSTHWQLPRELTDEHRVEQYAPEDIVDTLYDESYVIEGGWTGVADQSRTWGKIINAKRLVAH